MGKEKTCVKNKRTNMIVVEAKQDRGGGGG